MTWSEFASIIRSRLRLVNTIQPSLKSPAQSGIPESAIDEGQTLTGTLRSTDSLRARLMASSRRVVSVRRRLPCINCCIAGVAMVMGKLVAAGAVGVIIALVMVVMAVAAVVVVVDVVVVDVVVVMARFAVVDVADVMAGIDVVDDSDVVDAIVVRDVDDEASVANVR